MNDVRKTIDLIKGGLGRDEILSLLADANQSVRGSAVQSLVERFPHDDGTIDVLRTFIERAENRKPAMGTVSLSHLAMSLLATIGTPTARTTFDELRQSWPEHDKADLEWFIKNG
jgi:hypothetical protein